MMIAQNGRKQSILPKQVVFNVPGGPYKDTDVTKFASAFESADMSLLEGAWEMAGTT